MAFSDCYMIFILLVGEEEIWVGIEKRQKMEERGKEWGKEEGDRGKVDGFAEQMG